MLEMKCLSTRLVLVLLSAADIVQMHCSQYAQLFLATLLCLTPMLCTLTSYSKAYVGYLTVNFTSTFGLLAG